jgi:hypothetical protein
VIDNQPDGLDERDVAAVVSLEHHRRRKADDDQVVQLRIPEPDAQFVCSVCSHVAATSAHLIVHLMTEHPA